MAGACPSRPEWAQQSASIRITLGSLSLLPDLERCYESSVPDYIAATIWFTGTTKKSHAYVTLIDGFLILDHEDYGRSSSFYSYHHIDDKSPQFPVPLDATWGYGGDEGGRMLLAGEDGRRIYHNAYCAYLIKSQQPYGVDNCPLFDNATTALGYNCNGANTTCQSFVIYRTQRPYNTVASIASLLSANASQISKFNNLSENMALGINVRVIVPVTCSCSGKFYQANTTYVVQHDDSYFIITNDIFRALTTCSAIKNQKVSSIIDIDERLTVPLRCACPTTSQINDGVRYLMTFVVHRADSVSSIADYYGANLEQTFEANEKSEQNYVIVPTTTLLVPLENPPYDDLSLYYDIQTYNRSSNSNIIVAVCVPTIIVLLLLFGVCFCIHRRKSAKHSQDLQEFMIEAESLRFDFKTIRSATNNFSQHNKLGQGGFGGVYKVLC
ncbi:LysM domain receptor-like kinase 4 [Bienertia sinuspersici]